MTAAVVPISAAFARDAALAPAPSLPFSDASPSAAHIAPALAVVVANVSAVTACAHVELSRSTWSPVFRVRGFMPCMRSSAVSTRANAAPGAG